MAHSLPGSCTVALFDLDGTLIDTNELIIESFQHTLKKMKGISPSREEICKWFGEPLYVSFGRFSTDKDEVDEFVREYREYNELRHDILVKTIPSAFQLCLALRDRGVTLAIVTSKRNAMARRGLKLCGLEEFFPVVVGLDDTSLHKPHPEPALCALSLLKVAQGKHVAFIGDSPFDIECGKASGCTTIAVEWSALPRERLEAAGPDYFAAKPLDIASYFAASK